MHYCKTFYYLIPCVLSGVLASCEPVSLLNQVELTKPGRKFQERGAYATDCGITSQVESGRLGGSSGTNSGGC